MVRRRSRMAFVAPSSTFRAPERKLVKSGGRAGGRLKKVKKAKNSQAGKKIGKALVLAGASKFLTGKMKDKMSLTRSWRPAIMYGDRRDNIVVPAYQTNVTRRTQEDSQNYYTKNIFGTNGAKLRQLEKLYGSKKVIVNNSKEINYINGIPSYTAPLAVPAAKNQLTNIDFGFNQKLWLFPARANIDVAKLKSYFTEVMTEGESSLTRAYGHMLSTESQIELSTSNAFLPTRVTVHTCSFKDNFMDYGDMFKSMIPQDYDDVAPISGVNSQQSSIPQKYLLEERMSNNQVNNTLGRPYGAFSALVDPKTRFNYSRWFSRHVNILKSDSRVLGPGDVWTYTNVHNFKNPINLNWVHPVPSGSAVPFETFFVVECTGLKTTLYNKTYVDQDELTPFIGTSPGQINMELRTAMTGVVRPTPLNVYDGSASSQLYQGAFSAQVIHIQDKNSSRVTNLSRDKIGTRSEVFDPANNVQAFIPVSTDEQTAYARVITATPEPTLTDEVP
jgi:hypothetical protein